MKIRKESRILTSLCGRIFLHLTIDWKTTNAIERELGPSTWIISCHQNYEENLLKRRHFCLLNLCEWLGYKNQASFHPDKCRLNFLLIENLCLFHPFFYREYISRTAINYYFSFVVSLLILNRQKCNERSLPLGVRVYECYHMNGTYCY